MKQTETIFVTWSEYSSRAHSLAKAINAKSFFIGKRRQFKNVFLSILTYIPKSVKNIKLVFLHRPKVLIITNTQWIIAFLNLILGKIIRAKVVFDSHSSAFNHDFIKYPLYISKVFAKHAFISIVTNSFHKRLLESVGAKATIITDIPYEKEMVSNKKLNLSNNFNICFICTFSYDEPFLAVFNAANNLENIRIYVTGNYKKANIDRYKYKNVKFMGFLPNEDYKALLNSVDAVISLTKREYTMQRGGSEAISVGKPLIISNTQMLKEYFKRGTVFVELNEEGIKKGIKNLIRRYEFYLEEMKEFRIERRLNFKNALKKLKKELEIK